MESRVCTKCEILKISTDFHKKKAAKSGLDSWCKVCSLLAARERYEKNRAEIKVRRATYRKEHREKINAQSKEWRRKHPDKAKKKCEHNKLLHMCKQCGGGSICEHGRVRSECKACGVHSRFINRGFTTDQIKEMGSVKTCQFPNCLVQSNRRQFHSDHVHDGSKINPENYRGELCLGHNILLADLDRNPEQANAEAKEYMSRRPYVRRGERHDDSITTNSFGQSQQNESKRKS